jgi:hypothetical protein
MHFGLWAAIRCGENLEREGVSAALSWICSAVIAGAETVWAEMKFSVKVE